MCSILVFAIYVLKNRKQSATPRNVFATPRGVATHRLVTAGLVVQNTLSPNSVLFNSCIATQVWVYGHP